MERCKQLRKYKLLAIMPSVLSHENSYHAIFDGYTIPGMSHGISLALGYILCAISAIVIFLLIAKIVGAFMKKILKNRRIAYVITQMDVRK